MTDEALDLLARRVLLDALRSECEHENETTVTFMLSKKYQQQMRDMLADPQGWCKRKLRPAWKTALRRVAAFFLTALVGVSAWLAVDTQAREAFFGWAKEAYEHSIVYRIMPTDTAQTLPHCELTYLPAGFGARSNIYEDETLYTCIYEDSDTGSDFIVFYMLLNEELQTELLTNQQPEHLLINGVSAEYYGPSEESDTGNLLWIDNEMGVFCTLQGLIPKEEMLRIAEGMEFSRK